MSCFLKVNSNYSIAIAIIFCFLLSGCESIYRVRAYDGESRKEIAVRKTPPKIIYGQQAFVRDVYGYDDIEYGGTPSDLEKQAFIDAWQKTGLFSSVTKSLSKNPPAKGVFILRKCHADFKYSYDFIGGNGFLGFITLGLIPMNKTTGNYCDLKFYQNGALVGHSESFIYYEDWMKGWAALIYDTKESYPKSAQMCVNSLLSKMK